MSCVIIVWCIGISGTRFNAFGRMVRGGQQIKITLITIRHVFGIHSIVTPQARSDNSITPNIWFDTCAPAQQTHTHIHIKLLYQLYEMR